MRYIKLYEEINEYYYKISESEADKILNDMINISLTDNQLEILQDIIDDNNLKINTIQVVNNYYDMKNINILLINTVGNQQNFDYIKIFGLNDEWFVVKIILTLEFLVEDTRYYKCDQFEGLIKLLKDTIS